MGVKNNLNFTSRVVSDAGHTRLEKSIFLRLMFDFTEVVGKNNPAAQTMENTYFYINRGGRKS